jgi:SH3 domain-containing YSC84-like protein 1
MSSTSLRKSRPSRLSMEGYIWNAHDVVTEALHPRHDHNRAKIHELAQKSKAIVAVSIIHVGALLTGHYGTGVLVAKKNTTDDSVEWSAPTAIMVAGYSMGVLAGGKVDSTLIFILDQATLEDFCKKPQMRLGLTGGLSAGTKGGTGALGVDTGGAVSFSLTHGVFAGLGVQLGSLGEAPAQNEVFYGKKLNSQSIVLDNQVKIDPTSQIPNLHKRLNMLVEGISWEPSDEDLNVSKHFSEMADVSSRRFVELQSSRYVEV